jgi:hypothetical protein
VSTSISRDVNRVGTSATYGRFGKKVADIAKIAATALAEVRAATLGEVA